MVTKQPTSQTASESSPNHSTIASPATSPESWLDKALEAATAKFESRAQGYAHEIATTSSQMRKVILTAKAIVELREMMRDGSPLMESVMQAQGSPLGFMTDKRPGEYYPPAIVRECVIHAMLSGLSPFGNQFNIIGGRMMIVRNGWLTMLHGLGFERFPSFETTSEIEETPRAYRVRVKSEWVLNGVAGSLERWFFAQRHEKYPSTIDNIVGRVERKLMRAIYQQLCPSTIDDADEDTASDSITDAYSSAPANSPTAPTAHAETVSADAKAKAMQRIDRSFLEAKAAGLTAAQVTNRIQSHHKRDNRGQMTVAELVELAEWIESKIPRGDGQASDSAGMFDPTDDRGDAWEPPPAHTEKR